MFFTKSSINHHTNKEKVYTQIYKFKERDSYSIGYCLLFSISLLKQGRVIIQKKQFTPGYRVNCFLSLAERQGFEPWVPKGTTVFETAPIDHSGIFPGRF